MQDANLILGRLQKRSVGLSTQIEVDDDIFSEPRKKLMEYGELGGIYIVVSVEPKGNITDPEKTIDILDMRYAIKGDA